MDGSKYGVGVQTAPNTAAVTKALLDAASSEQPVGPAVQNALSSLRLPGEGDTLITTPLEAALTELCVGTLRELQQMRRVLESNPQAVANSAAGLGEAPSVATPARLIDRPTTPKTIDTAALEAGQATQPDGAPAEVSSAPVLVVDGQESAQRARIDVELENLKGMSGDAFVAAAKKLIGMGAELDALAGGGSRKSPPAFNRWIRKIPKVGRRLISAPVADGTHVELVALLAKMRKAAEGAKLDYDEAETIASAAVDRVGGTDDAVCEEAFENWGLATVDREALRGKGQGLRAEAVLESLGAVEQSSLGKSIIRWMKAEGATTVGTYTDCFPITHRLYFTASGFKGRDESIVRYGPRTEHLRGAKLSEIEERMREIADNPSRYLKRRV